MKVFVKDLGILRQAEFEIGDLTIICGENNTGKTYATYALYGFLKYWSEAFIHDFLEDECFEKLISQGSLKFSLNEITANANSIVSEACEEYAHNLSMVFGLNKNNFSDAEFKVQLKDVEVANGNKKLLLKEPKGKPLCEIIKTSNDDFITLKILASADIIHELDKGWFLYQVNQAILRIVFDSSVPEPFIASIERTGAATFQKELDFSRNRLLEHVSNPNKDVNPIDLLNTYFEEGYALPVKRDVDFIRDLENISKLDSEILKIKPDLLKTFYLLSGGEYGASKTGIYYVPDKSKIKLTMGESASSVRSLLNLGMYIKHIAKPGDILMIDEPELNMHPKNQRTMARLLAQLVNLGIKVFITTHSDYLLKEFNALIMMKNAGAGAAHIMKKFQYEENELLDANKVKAYIAKKNLIKIEGLSRKTNVNTFVQAHIGEQGIEIEEFDDTINEMNEIQNELLFCGDTL